MIQITLSEQADGSQNATITDGSFMTTIVGVTATLVPVSPPPPPPPPPTSTSTSSPGFDLQVMATNASAPDATVTGTVNGNAVNLTVKAGQRVPMVTKSDGTYDFACGAVTYYPDGAICIENSYVGFENASPADAAIDLTVTVGGNTFTTGAKTLWNGSWTRPFWVNTPVATPLSTALRAIFPNYGTGSETASRVTQYANASNGIMGIGLFFPLMAQTGERDDLGLLPAWDACYLVNPSTDAANVVRGQGDASAPFPFHAINTRTNRMLLGSDYSQVSWQPSLRGYKGNPYRPAKTNCTLSLDQGPAHGPAFNALACALFRSPTNPDSGTEFDKASCAQWANFITVLFWNWSYRTADGPISIWHGAGARAPAWIIRSCVQAAKLTTEQPELFDGYAKSVIAEMQTVFSNQKSKGHMPMVIPLVVYPTNNASTGYAFSNFEMCFLGSALGYALQNGYTTAQGPFDLISECTIDSLTKYQHEFATKYSVAYYDTSRNPAANWGQCLQFQVQHTPSFSTQLSCAEGSLALQQAIYAPNAVPSGVVAGDFQGYPESGNGWGYSAILMSHTSFLPTWATDQTGGTAAHDKVMANMHEDYSADPKYNLAPLPRAA